MRKALPLALTFVSGIIVVLANFLAPDWFVQVNREISLWFQIVAALFCALGVANLSRIHSRRVSRHAEGWAYSIVLFVSMFGFVLVALAVGQQHELYRNLYNNTIVPLNATMYSVLVFYIASAAYRAFRIRTLEAAILLVTASIVMLGKAPIGEALLGDWVVRATTWILDIPNVAGMRGIQLGATLGGLAMALRVLVGIERSHFGGTGE